MLKVYFLDDEFSIRKIFEQYFSTDNILVKTFGEPAEAIEACKKELPDLFFTDLNMPGMNGEEVAKVLPKELPKFLITGELCYEGHEVFSEVFFKPLPLDDIENLMAEYLER